MYNRNQKDNYRKKIEQLLEGKKRRYTSEPVNNNINTSSDDNNNANSNDINDIANTSTATSTATSIATSIAANTNDSVNYIKKWAPNSNIIEGIRKFLKAR
jgi:hypothetical protein